MLHMRTRPNETLVIDLHCWLVDNVILVASSLATVGFFLAVALRLSRDRYERLCNNSRRTSRLKFASRGCGLFPSRKPAGLVAPGCPLPKKWRSAPCRGAMPEELFDNDDAASLEQLLAGRIAEVRAAEVARDRAVARNWTQSQWTVRGVVVDQVELSHVALADDRIAVGTKDGMVYVLDLGEERLAEFERLRSRGMQPSAATDNDPYVAFDDAAGAAYEALNAKLRRQAAERQAAKSEDTRGKGGGVVLDAEAEAAMGGKGKPPLVRQDMYKADHDYDKDGSPFRVVAEYGGPVGVHEGGVTALLWHGRTLVSGGRDGTVAVWSHGNLHAKVADDQASAAGGVQQTSDAIVRGAAGEGGALPSELGELRALRDKAVARGDMLPVPGQVTASEGDVAPQYKAPLHLFVADSSWPGPGPNVDGVAALAPVRLGGGRADSQEDGLVAVLSQSGGLRVWNVTSGRPAGPATRVPPVSPLDMSPLENSNGVTMAAMAVDAAAIQEERSENSMGSGELSQVFGSGCMAVLEDLEILAVGTSEGRIVMFALKDLVDGTEDEGVNDTSMTVGPMPIHSFRAHEPVAGAGLKAGVTAMFAASQGIDQEMPASLPDAQVLLTGGGDGDVKQWEIFISRGGDNGEERRVRHWPQLATQRLKRRVHTISDAHSGDAIVAICGDAGKIVSASAADGTVKAWRRSDGRELMMMAGFESTLASVAISRQLLVCDGMGDSLCLHDFSEIQDDDIDDLYDIQMNLPPR